MAAADIVEIMARAFFDADNGIDGDQIGDMIYEDRRINGDSVEQAIALTLDVIGCGMRAAAAALNAAGYAIVPREPTEAMLQAAAPALKEVDAYVAEMQLRGRGPITYQDGKPPLYHAWQAMVTAAEG